MSYSPDFGGVKTKIDRAREHTKALNDETGWLYDPSGNPVRSQVHRIPIRLGYEPDTCYHVFRLASAPSEDVVRRWGVVTGDAIHNLRSALDHLVWQLSLVGTGGAQPKTVDIIKFPIYDNPSPSNSRPEDFQKTTALYKVPLNTGQSSTTISLTAAGSILDTDLSTLSVDCGTSPISTNTNW